MTNFADVLQRADTFDIIVMRRSALNHQIINLGSHINCGYSEYGHIVMCIRGDSFPTTSPYYDPKQIYALEATGTDVQFLPLEESIASSSKGLERIAWCRLRPECRPHIRPERFNDIFHQQLKRQYDMNPVVLAATIMPLLRPLRDHVIYPFRKLIGTHDKNTQCVQISVDMMKSVGCVPDSVSSVNLMPTSIMTNPATRESYAGDDVFPAIWEPAELFSYP
jgi:hypothetical protein